MDQNDLSRAALAQHPPELGAWLAQVRQLRAAGHTLDEARAIAGPMPRTEPDLAGQIAYGILLAAIAEFGWTKRAVAAAWAAVATSTAFEEGDH